MCNINFIYRKSRKPTKLISSLMNVMSWESFKLNKDGEGYLTVKKGKPNHARFTSKIKYTGSFYVLATHQRITTSGEGNGNTHPHETKDLILMHNGIFSNLGDTKRSDTYYYVEELQKSYEKNEGNIIEAIKEISLIIGGSYSIMVFEKPTGKWYYYKNSLTSMYFAEDKNYLIMSTEFANVDYCIFALGMKQESAPIKSYSIFEINSKGLNIVGTFEEQVCSYYSESNSGWSSYTDNYYTGDNVTFANSRRKRIYTEPSERRTISKYIAETFSGSLNSLEDKVVAFFVPKSEYKEVYYHFSDVTKVREGRKFTLVEVTKRDMLEAIEFNGQAEGVVYT